MLNPKDWQDEPELFEVVYEALESSSDFTVIARDEQGSYGERGVMQIRTPDGRVFHLSLSEAV